MELELQKEHFTAYQPQSQVCDTHEETMETIVPDYCPDVARIVDASGCLFLKSKEVTESKVNVSGSVKMTILYLGEDSPTLRSLEYTIPLEYGIEGKFSGRSDELHISGHISSNEVRLINPRKVFTRVGIDFVLTPYTAAVLVSCSTIPQQKEYQIETLCENHEFSLIKALRQKDFVFSEEVALSGAKEPIKELLRMCSRVRVTDCKPISNKIILKGIVCLDGLYLSESGAISQLSSELPFSQIIDGAEDDGADVSADCTLYLTGAEYRIGSENAPDDTRTVSIKLFLNAFAVLRQKRSVCCIADLYSTAYDLDTEMQNVQLVESPELMSREQNVRMTIETGNDVSNILSSSVSFGTAQMTQNADGSALSATAEVKVLYLDDNGVPYLAQRRNEVSLAADSKSISKISVRSVCAGDIAAAAVNHGIEVRFPVKFTFSAAASPCYPCLMTLAAQKCEERSESVPSLILKALTPNQKLWDLAKQYRTTVNDILSANELAEEAAAAVGQLLLIPRKR